MHLKWSWSCRMRNCPGDTHVLEGQPSNSPFKVGSSFEWPCRCEYCLLITGKVIFYAPFLYWISSQGLNIDTYKLASDVSNIICIFTALQSSDYASRKTIIPYFQDQLQHFFFYQGQLFSCLLSIFFYLIVFSFIIFHWRSMCIAEDSVTAYVIFKGALVLNTLG